MAQRKEYADQEKDRLPWTSHQEHLVQVVKSHKDASSRSLIPHYFPTLGALFCTYLEFIPSHFIVEFIWILFQSLLPESSEEVLLFMIVTEKTSQESFTAEEKLSTQMNYMHLKVHNLVGGGGNLDRWLSR